MSAIAGMIDWRGAPAGPAVRKMLGALALHGRDGEGFWDGGDVALGWRQTILHAEDRADRQPLTGGGGRFKLVFDGRIDNREELARALALEPERARDWPDSAYALAAFEKWGEDCVPHLLGDFAFAVWDAEKRELFLARDHIGTRPLYFFRDEHFLMFATTPSALFSNQDVPRDIDDELFLVSLSPVALPRGATIYRDISRVAPGECVVFTQSALRHIEHWQPEQLNLLSYARDDEYVEAFREILEESIRCRLRTIHPTGSHLSSGWDSSTVTIIAARLLAARHQRLTAYTAVSPVDWKQTRPFGWRTDEGPIATAVAQRLANVDHVLVRGRGRFDFEALDHHADAFEHPLRDLNNGGWREDLHGRARERGIRVMLSGGMGNRTLSYDGLGLLPYLLRHGRLVELLTEWTLLHRKEGTAYRNLVALTLGPYFPDALWRFVDRLLGRPDPASLFYTGINADFFSAQKLREVVRSRSLSKPAFRRGDDRAMHHFCVRTPDLGNVWGGALAAYDLEIRDPLGDRRLRAFRARLPERQFLRQGQTRWLARRAMAGVLPKEVTEQRLRGRQAAEWFEAASGSLDLLREEVGRLGRNDRLQRIINLAEINGLLRNWPAIPTPDQAAAYQRLLSIISAAHFMRRFMEKPEGAPVNSDACSPHLQTG